MYGDYGSHEDWNPMEDAYFNERFNTYETGPGADLDRSLQPCFRKRNNIQRPLCKLYVHRIPWNMTEEGLRNVFRKFGNLRSSFLSNKTSPNNSLWGLVEYTTVSEGQKAINALNGRPPLDLSVQFARSEEEKDRIRKESEQENFFRTMSYSHSSYDLPEMESPYPRSMGRGRGVPILASASEDSYYSNKPYHLYEDELMFRKPILKGVFNPYRGSVWDPANAHVMNEVSLTVNSSEDGRRISMGRAIPCVDSRRRRLQHHKFALQHSDLDPNGLQIGLCVFCSEPSLYSCERCGAWYCSEECQKKDWLIHKEFCMPYLCRNTDNSETRKGLTPKMNVTSEEKEKKISGLWNERKGGQRQEVPCDRLKKPERKRFEDAKGKDGERKNPRWGEARGPVRNNQKGDCGAEIKNPQRGESRQAVRKYQKREGREEAKNSQRGEGKDGGRNNQRKVDGCKKNLERESDNNRIASPDDDWEVDKGPCLSRNSSIQIEERKILSSEDLHKISETVDLPHEKFTMVSVGSVVSPGHYWVQSKDEELDLISVMKIMNEKGKLRKEPLNLKAGDFCLAMFEGFPYRAKVLSMQKDEAKVFFVDFGNEDTCKFSSIGELPSEAQNYRSLAIEIVMADQTPQKFLSLSDNDMVSVKPINKQKNAMIVQVEGVKYMEIPSSPQVIADVKKGMGMNSSTSHKVRMQWPKSILELVKEGITVTCNVFDVMTGEEDSAILRIAFNDVKRHLVTVFQHLADECSKMVCDPKFKPKVGDLIAGSPGDSNWLRGVVLREEPTGWMVAFCDTGSIAVIKDVMKIPDDDKYREAPAFAVQCRVLKSFLSKKDLYSEDKLSFSSSLHLNIVACTGDEVVAKMLSKNEELLCTVKLEAWRPVVSNLSSHILNSGDRVHIVTYINTAAIYVQPADEMNQKKIQSLLQEVAGVCVEAKGRMKEVPDKGTLVACKYTEDGNYYRALVLDVKEEDKIFVNYVDFGNQEWVSMDVVHKLPDELKKIPCYAVKIGLNIPGISQLSAEAVKLLNTLTLSTEELKIVIPDGDLRNCELITKSGHSLNDKLASLVGSSVTSSSTKSDGRIKWTSEMVGKLEIPEGGSLSMKFLILQCPGKCTVVGFPAEDPRIAHVYQTFPAEVSEYCEKCPQVPYVPVAYEMCLAKFTDGLWYRGFAVDAKGDESQIYFVDFGNWMKVKHKDIRKILPEFMKVPFLAIICTYKGFEEETITEEQVKVLKQYLKPNALVFASVSLGNGPDEYILDISEVTEALRSKNLLPKVK